MNRDRVLVVLDREDVAQFRSHEYMDAFLRVRRSLLAALDREEQVEMIEDAVAGLLPASVRAVTPERIARAVLAALEGDTE